MVPKTQVASFTATERSKTAKNKENKPKIIIKHTKNPPKH